MPELSNGQVFESERERLNCKESLNVFFPLVVGMKMYGISDGYRSAWTAILGLMYLRLLVSVADLLFFLALPLSDIVKMRNISIVLSNIVFIGVIHYFKKHHQVLADRVAEQTEHLPSHSLTFIKKRVRLLCTMIVAYGLVLTAAVTGMLVQLVPDDLSDYTDLGKYLRALPVSLKEILLTTDWVTRVWLSAVPEAVIWAMFGSLCLVIKGMFLTYRNYLKEAVTSEESAKKSGRLMFDTFFSFCNIIIEFNTILSPALFWMYFSAVLNIFTLTQGSCYDAFYSGFPVTVQIYRVTRLLFYSVIFIFVSHYASSPVDDSENILPLLYNTVQKLPMGSYEERCHTLIIERIRNYSPKFTGYNVFVIRSKLIVNIFIALMAYILIVFGIRR